MNYTDFLKKKKKHILDIGFEPKDLNKNLFPFQKHIVKIALKKGKYAIFADCGLGKTIMQLEWAQQIIIKENKPVLILCPLAVSQQTINEGTKFGINCNRWIDNNLANQIYIANYEKLHNIDTSKFAGIVLDESSILKNFTGKYRQRIIETFSHTKYKLACTATPSPNDPMELGNHAQFLNVMSFTEMLSIYFINDMQQTQKWRIKGHAQDAFWKFISSWAMMINKPSDIGFEDDGFDLPDLNFIEQQISTPKRNNGQLFNDVSVSATNFNQELRLTILPRIEMAADIANSSDENFIIWCKHNEESKQLTQLINESREVKGSDNDERKEQYLIGFGKNEFKCLVTKPKIAQFGLNYQNCHNQIFAALDFSFEGLYQAIRRSYRFGQDKPVNIYIITTDTMQNVIQSIKQKQKNFNKMKDSLTKNYQYAN